MELIRYDGYYDKRYRLSLGFRLFNYTIPTAEVIQLWMRCKDNHDWRKKRIWYEVVMAYLMIISWNMPRENDKDKKTPQSGQQVLWPRFKPGTF
jgi:hypothetical protein